MNHNPLARTIVRALAVAGIVLSLMLAGGAPSTISIGSVITAAGR